MRNGSLTILLLFFALSDGFKISVRQVKGDAFEVDVESTEKVKDLKMKIAALKPDMPAETLSVVAKGKELMDDEATLEASGIAPGGLVVVLTRKPKPTPKSGTAALDQLMTMGFERDHLEQCLKAAAGNVERAVEYLLAGLPTPTPAQPVQTTIKPVAQAVPVAKTSPPTTTIAATTARVAETTGPSQGIGGAPGRSLPELIQQFRESPEFQQILQNPEMIQQILPMLEQRNPQLFQFLSEHPEALSEILQMPIIALSAADKAAIQRLMALCGVDEQEALQAYLAFDKNEELAANFLFDNKDINLVQISEPLGGARQTQKQVVHDTSLLGFGFIVVALVSLKRLRSQRRALESQETLMHE